MGILNEISKLVERDIEDIETEEDIESQEDMPTVKKIANKIVRDEEEEEKFSGSDVGEILKHIEAVRSAAEFIDKLTTDQSSTTAFEVEVSLRKALDKMEQLSDEVYKKKSKENKGI